MKSNYFNPEKGFLRDKPKKSIEIAALKIPIAPKKENYIAAENLLRLYYFTFNKNYFNLAEIILRSLWREKENYNIFDEDYALALERYYNYSISMTAIGRKKNRVSLITHIQLF